MNKNAGLFFMCLSTTGSPDCIQGQEDRWSFRLACGNRFNRPAANPSNSRA